MHFVPFFFSLECWTDKGILRFYLDTFASCLRRLYSGGILGSLDLDGVGVFLTVSPSGRYLAVVHSTGELQLCLVETSTSLRNVRHQFFTLFYFALFSAFLVNQLGRILFCALASHVFFFEYVCWLFLCVLNCFCLFYCCICR